MGIEELKTIDGEHEKLWIKMERMKAEQEAEFFIMNSTLKQIHSEVSETLAQARKTNGRVTKLEADYVLISTLKSNKWLILIGVIGLLKLYELINLEWIYDKIINLF